MELHPNPLKQDVDVHFRHEDSNRDVAMEREKEGDSKHRMRGNIYPPKFGKGERSDSQKNFKYAIQCSAHGPCLIYRTKVNVMSNYIGRGTYKLTNKLLMTHKEATKIGRMSAKE